MTEKNCAKCNAYMTFGLKNTHVNKSKVHQVCFHCYLDTYWQHILFFKHKPQQVKKNISQGVNSGKVYLNK